MVCVFPWEQQQTQLPWTQGGVYPRTVSVLRGTTGAEPNDTIGGIGYTGDVQVANVPNGFVVLFTGLSAAIQIGAVGRTTKNALPSDAVTKPVWNIFIPASSIALYDIRDRDTIVDDEGYRYEVGANYWTGLGYQLSTIRLEA
jgi:hypothetical protein